MMEHESDTAHDPPPAALLSLSLNQSQRCNSE